FAELDVHNLLKKGATTPTRANHRSQARHPSSGSAVAQLALGVHVARWLRDRKFARLVWEFFRQVVFWFVAGSLLERRGRSSSRRCDQVRGARGKVSRDRNASAA